MDRKKSVVDRKIENMSDQYCTVKQAMDFLGVSYMTLYRRLNEGKIRRFKIGPHRVVLSLDDVKAMRNYYEMTPVEVEAK
jgi:excisionase family DNA binding protein